MISESRIYGMTRIARIKAMAKQNLFYRKFYKKFGSKSLEFERFVNWTIREIL